MRIKSIGLRILDLHSTSLFVSSRFSVIEMQYNQPAEKTIVTDGVCVNKVQPSSSNIANQMIQTRKRLIILLSICIVVIVFNSLYIIFRIQSKNDTNQAQLIASFISNVISILYYALAIVAAYKYHKTGLQAVGWFGIISIITSVFIMIGVLVMIVIVLNKTTTDKNFIGFIFIIVLICFIIGLAFAIFVVKLSFKLVRLIRENQSAIHQNI